MSSASSMSSLFTFLFFFFNDTATTEIYTLSPTRRSSDLRRTVPSVPTWRTGRSPAGSPRRRRSEEHTSELQSHLNLVCRLLLEKTKQKHNSPLFDIQNIKNTQTKTRNN